MGLKILDCKRRKLYYSCAAKTKVLISCAVTTQLICICVRIGKSPFFHDVAQMMVMAVRAMLI